RRICEPAEGEKGPSGGAGYSRSGGGALETDPDDEFCDCAGRPADCSRLRGGRYQPGRHGRGDCRWYPVLVDPDAICYSGRICALVARTQGEPRFGGGRTRGTGGEIVAPCVLAKWQRTVIFSVLRINIMEVRKFFFLILAVLVWPAASISQELLTLEDAISIALKNNFDIQMVAKDVAIAENNVNVANAGMLPSVTGNMSRTAAIQNMTQTLLSGETRELDGAKSNSFLYGAALDWTIFDGFRMFARYEQLKELKALGEETMKTVILATVFDVIASYYDLVQQQHLIDATKTALD